MEQFSENSWSSRATQHVEGLGESKQKIAEYEKKLQELEKEISAKPVDQRREIFSQITQIRRNLMDARNTLERLKREGRQNLKKAA